jgi:hypothetical protein
MLDIPTTLAAGAHNHLNYLTLKRMVMVAYAFSTLSRLAMLGILASAACGQDATLLAAGTPQAFGVTFDNDALSLEDDRAPEPRLAIFGDRLENGFTVHQASAHRNDSLIQTDVVRTGTAAIRFVPGKRSPWDYLQFRAPEAMDEGVYAGFSFWFKGDIAEKGVGVQWRDGNMLKSLYTEARGFVAESEDEWQHVVVPFGHFGIKSPLEEFGIGQDCVSAPRRGCGRDTFVVDDVALY